MATTKTLPMNHGGPRGIAPIAFKKKRKAMITKLKEVRSAKQELNEKLGGNPHKIIYEILTNIPKLSNNITWKWNKEKEGLRLTFIQDISTTIDTLLENLLTSDKLDDESHYENKPEDTGSVFGTGLSLIDYFTDEFTFSTNGETYNFKTDERYSNELTDGVVMEMLIPFHSSMLGWKRFVEKSREMISSVDMFVSGREHKVIVSGLTNTENVELSKPITYDNILWKTKTNGSKNTPDYNTLLDGDNNPLVDVVTEVDVMNETRTVKLSNFKVGKLYNKPTGLGVDKDKPMMVLVCKESGQIIGKVYWKGSYPVSVNNSIIISEVSKEDLRWLFSTGDKFEGFNPIFEDELKSLMKTNLLKYYPDSQVMEVVSQKWIYDIIVNNLIGKKPSDMFRDEMGLSFMNKLSTEVREKLVHMEWSSGKGRYDFIIFLSESGKITDTTPIMLIECKRKGFTKSDMNQLVNYLAGKRMVVSVIGTSLNITSNQLDYWNENSAKIQGSGQLKNHVDFKLLDIVGDSDDWGFEGHVDEYTKIVVDEIQNMNN